MHVINSQTHKKRSRRQYACGHSKRDYEGAIPHSPLLTSDTCATELCLDWRVSDSLVGRGSDQPLQDSTSAKRGVKMQDATLRRLRLRVVSPANCFHWCVLLAAICHNGCCVQQEIRPIETRHLHPRYHTGRGPRWRPAEDSHLHKRRKLPSDVIAVSAAC